MKANNLNFRKLGYLALGVILFAGAWVIKPSSEAFEITGHPILKIPIRSEIGFSQRRRFTVPSPSRLHLQLARHTVHEDFDTRIQSDPNELGFSYSVTADGTAVVQGNFPPYSNDIIKGAEDFRPFTSFDATPDQTYELRFRVTAASSHPIEIATRIEIIHTPPRIGSTRAWLWLLNGITGTAVMFFLIGLFGSKSGQENILALAGHRRQVKMPGHGADRFELTTLNECVAGIFS